MTKKIALCLMLVAVALVPAACGKRGAPTRPGGATTAPANVPETIRPSQSTVPEWDQPIPGPRTMTP